jgi:D-methionine transport system ATP-binding protein
MIELKNLSKEFQSPDGTVEALKDVSLVIPDGDIFGIIGMSGAGKSTLVRCVNLLERPSSGSVEIDGVRVDALPERELRLLRRKIAMIFQGFHLLMQRNCLKNVRFPLELAGVPRAEANRRALELLELVGLADKAGAYPAQLSGGQQQRVAIARALATEPEILLCDEATSALDPNTTSSILELIRSIHAKLGLTVIVITHQMSVVEQICKHLAILDQGRVVEQGEVTEIFAHPRSAAAKRLVFPDENTETALPSRAGERLIRVVFNGAAATGSPLIARMAAQKGVEANIVYASAKSIGDKVYGSMLLGLPDDEDQLRIARDYLTSVPNVVIDEVSAHAG